MVTLSNNDARTLQRLLGRLQEVAGQDTNSKNIKRQASLLNKRIGVKLTNNGKARSELLQR